MTLFVTALTACVTIIKPEQSEKENIILSRELLGKGKMSAAQLTKFFMLQNPSADITHIIDFALIYIQEAADENINSDIAFAQMCLETGYLKFGGLVQPEWHNYCGLGAMSVENPGCIFETERLGVRAHIQHLQAYATTAEVQLNNELVDPRYSWVHKTKLAKDVYELAGTWATDPEYGNKINNILIRMEEIINQ